MTARRDRFAEGVDILTDLSRSDGEAIRVYDRTTRGLRDQNAALGFYLGLKLRALKKDREQDARAIQRWADDGGRA